MGGSFLVTAVLFSSASGIFHPYYVSLLAPFAAALVGAGTAQLAGGGLQARILAPVAVAAGVAVELVVRANYQGQLNWLPALLIVVGVGAVIALVAFSSRIVRMAALGTALAALLFAPGVWAFDTLGHAASGTFPAGGPESAETMGGGGFGGPGGARFGARRIGAPGSSGPQLFGPGGAGAPAQAPAGALAGSAPQTTGVPTGQPGTGFGGFAGPGGGGAAGPGGGFGGGDQSLKSVLSYVAGHGGGTIAVSSQSSAASAIIASNANVAGIGGFSGRESDVSVAWLAREVSTGKIRWVVGEASGGAGGFGGRLPGDTRTGSKTAMSAVEAACKKVTLSGSSASTAGTLYDCQGRAAALARA